MSIPDLVNGVFFSGLSLICCLNVRRLLRERKSQVVERRVATFFLAWSLWSLYYFSSLHQWFITAADAVLVAANVAWVVLALRLMKAQETQKWKEHIENHKAYNPECWLCRAMEPYRTFLPTHDPALQALPEIKHTFKCSCELCTDPNIRKI